MPNMSSRRSPIEHHECLVNSYIHSYSIVNTYIRFRLRVDEHVELVALSSHSQSLKFDSFIELYTKVI